MTGVRECHYCSESDGRRIRLHNGVWSCLNTWDCHVREFAQMRQVLS